jgi:nucleotide-binding universal stress UspA family protein
MCTINMALLNTLHISHVCGKKDINTVKIKSMLARLQQALDGSYSAEQLVLLPGQSELDPFPQPKDSIDLVVGYSGSTNSQVALDLTLWIAHQTRLTTQKQVLVHVVYVVNPQISPPKQTLAPLWNTSAPAPVWAPVAEQLRPNRRETALLLEPEDQARGRSPSGHHSLDLCHLQPAVGSIDFLEQADCVLWQARCLAEEWRGSLEAHLRFGSVSSELRNVVNAQSADLLVVGCSNKKHTLVKKLTRQFPCPVLGIPIVSSPGS